MKRPAIARMKRWSILGLACAAAASQAPAAQTATSGKPTIYVCTDAKGHRITSDRPIPECLDRDQNLLNPDGSLRGVRERYLSPAERAARDEEQRRKQLEAAARMDAVRRDRNLLARYPNQAAHDKARAAALDDVQHSIEMSRSRLLELERERQPLLSEAEFYAKQKHLPPKLKRALDDNEASADAQKSLIQNQEIELRRVTALYDTELAKLKRLWAGAPPGSLDAIQPTGASAPAPASAPSSRPRQP